ncbi:phage holin, lambda family [Providencia sp. PROV170]|nr:phage holin, lambda family [Providencia rettgeri]ELR5055137.1 phage holin, lambda family [Providencia rettgeri]ELR5157591.1 phage holin, lambda family [Providencia rettgeri]ELR5184372.1 phage holin, lambda family [Providencia rettgeri]ELR5276853.1 phage holin, lambda family [Providencia rettgeri]
MRMPDKNTDIWVQIWDWITINAPLIAGVLLASMTAFTREKREGSGWKASLAEAAICAFISIGIITALEYAKLPNSLAQFFGVFIGFLGTKKIGGIVEAVMSFFKNKFGVNK